MLVTKLGLEACCWHVPCCHDTHIGMAHMRMQDMRRCAPERGHAQCHMLTNECTFEVHDQPGTLGTNEDTDHVHVAFMIPERGKDPKAPRKSQHEHLPADESRGGRITWPVQAEGVCGASWRDIDVSRVE